MQFSTVLAAIDLEDDLAEGVVRAAHSLAQKDGAKLTVTSVWPAVSTVTPAFSAEVAASSAVLTQSAIEQHREGREAAETSLKAMAAQLAPGAEVVILDGDPADATVDYAQTIHADLLVTGSHQRSFWNALFQGSASRELVREAPCAVFLVTKAFAAKLKGA